MDWTTLGSVLGSNFFIAIVALATARWQINNAKEQLDKQLQSERERERRERRREIRTEPLRKFGGELATLAAKQTLLIACATRPMSLPQFQEALKKIWSYLEGGEFLRALYLLDESEIIKMVQDILNDWDWTQPMPTDIKKAGELYAKSQKKIQAVQSLINKQLEEL